MTSKRITDLSATTTLTVSDLGIAEVTAGSRKVRRGVDGTAVGTAFGTPTTGDRLYRTDRNIEYYYDGTRWLSTTLYHLPIPEITNVTGTTNGTVTANPWSGLYDIYVSGILLSKILVGSGNWTATIHNQAGASDNALVSSSAFTNTTWDSATLSVASVVTSTTNVFYLLVTENSGTANCYASAVILYRLVG